MMQYWHTWLMVVPAMRCCFKYFLIPKQYYPLVENHVIHSFTHWQKIISHFQGTLNYYTLLSIGSNSHHSWCHSALPIGEDSYHLWYFKTMLYNITHWQKCISLIHSTLKIIYNTVHWWKLISFIHETEQFIIYNIFIALVLLLYQH